MKEKEITVLNVADGRKLLKGLDRTLTKKLSSCQRDKIKSNTKKFNKQFNKLK